MSEILPLISGEGVRRVYWDERLRKLGGGRRLPFKRPPSLASLEQNTATKTAAVKQRDCALLADSCMLPS